MATLHLFTVYYARVLTYYLKEMTASIMYVLQAMMGCHTVIQYCGVVRNKHDGMCIKHCRQQARHRQWQSVKAVLVR